MILCVGESIIDFISCENGKSLKDCKTFSKQPGGSSANVSIGLSKLEIPTAFSGIVGADEFGEYLENFLISNSIDCSLLKKSNKYRTPIVFVALDENGKNEFLFYRDFALGNEYKITSNDLKKLKDLSILHFSSVVLRQVNFKLQLAKIIETTRFKLKKLVHFDTNIRFSLWQNQKALKQTIIDFIKLSDIVKFSEDELYFISGIKDIEKSLKSTKLLKGKLVIVTVAEHGAYAYWHNEIIYSPAFKIKAIDTTGAGDAFVSALLSRLYKENITTEKDLAIITKKQLNDWLKFANAAGALCCAKRGATTGLADEQTIFKFCEK